MNDSFEKGFLEVLRKTMKMFTLAINRRKLDEIFVLLSNLRLYNLATLDCINLILNVEIIFDIASPTRNVEFCRVYSCLVSGVTPCLSVLSLEDRLIPHLGISVTCVNKKLEILLKGLNGYQQQK
jgi:hypothetical protein